MASPRQLDSESGAWGCSSQRVGRRVELRKVQGQEQAMDVRTLATGASVSLTGEMMARGVNMLTQVFMARWLGAASFGLYAIGWTLLRLFGIVSTLGLEAGVTYFGTDYRRNNAEKFKGAVLQSIAIPFVVGTAIGAALWYAAPVLAADIFHKPEASAVIRLFAPAFALYGVGFVANGVTRLAGQMQYSAYSSVARSLSTLAFFCCLFFLGWKLEGAVIASVAGLAVSALAAMYFVVRLFPVLFSKEVRARWIGCELLWFSLSVQFAGLSYTILMFMDRLFVASFCTSADTGIYQAASQLILLFGILTGAFHAIFRPMVADLHARGEEQRLAELYRVCPKWTFYASIPLFLTIICAPGPVIEFVYGAAYLPAAVPLVILSVGQLFVVLTAPSQTMLVMTGRQRIYSYATLSALLGDLVLSFVLVPGFGVTGAAVAAAISNVILNSFTTVAVRKQLGMWSFDARYIKGFVAAGVTLAALVMLRVLTVEPAVTVSMLSVVSLICFAGSLSVIGLDTEDREAMGFLWSRVRPLRA